ncbi:MAG: hypothetical protein K0S77_3546 [Pseudomonas sp.]|jgi:hypothetical protein|nr:hypothetical protein [Pseudomonas sp.]
MLPKPGNSELLGQSDQEHYYTQYITQYNADRDLIPHEVVSRIVDDASPIRAWHKRGNAGGLDDKLLEKDVPAAPARRLQNDLVLHA